MVSFHKLNTRIIFDFVEIFHSDLFVVVSTDNTHYMSDKPTLQTKDFEISVFKLIL